MLRATTVRTPFATDSVCGTLVVRRYAAGMVIVAPS